MCLKYVIKVISNKLLHSFNALFFIRQKNAVRTRASVRCSNICLHHFTNLFKLSSAARFLPRFLLGLACFLRLPLLSSAIITLYFVQKKLSRVAVRSVCVCVMCLSRVPAWEWMVMRHRLRSQRETQTLMGLQAEATSREEEWCQQQRLALRSLLASWTCTFLTYFQSNLCR